jgi:diguanylate cyclase (GGDEF)-like protein
MPRRPDFAAFVRAARTLNSSLDVHAVLRGLLEGLEELLQPSSWSLLLRDDVTGNLVFTLVRSEVDAALAGKHLDPGEGIAGWVMKSGETLLISDVTKDTRFSSRMDQVTGYATRSIVAVPLRVENRPIGVLEIVNAMDERIFTPDDVEILQAFADFTALAIDNARAHTELLELTRNDPLSGLRNSRFFLACVDEAVGKGERFAVLFSDMDRFKQLVDGHGHMNGSAALAEVGRVYAVALAPGEIGCRFGGDEFAFLLPGADGSRAATRCNELASLIANRTFLVDEGINASLEASFGWAAFPEDALTPRVLLHIADSRMYEAKRNRKRARGAAEVEAEGAREEP